MASWNSRIRLVVAVAALCLWTPAWASASASPGDETHVRAAGADVATLIAMGVDRSSSFRELVARVERTNWVVFVMRGRCPSPEIVACLLHTVARIDGQPYLRILIDNRQFRSPHVEIGSIAHELQHALEAAESDDVVDRASLDARFRRIGYISLQTRTTTSYETDAARRAGTSVLRELEHFRPGNAGRLARPTTITTDDDERRPGHPREGAEHG